MIDSHIKHYSSFPAPAPIGAAHFDTALEVIACSKCTEWSRREFELLEFLCKRIEISRCLYDSYLPSGGRASTTVLDVERSTLALLLLLKDMYRLVDERMFDSAIKRLNAVLKLLDTLKLRAVSQEIVDLVQASSTRFLQSTAYRGLQEASSTPDDEPNPAQETLPITVLFWEGPIARAYLATLKSMGVRPEKIIQLVSGKDLASKKPVGRFLPGPLRLAYACAKQRNSIHHWSGVLQRTETTLYRSIRSEIEHAFGIEAKVIDDALALQDLNEYSPAVEQLLVDDLADERLLQRLSALPETQLLFTGGGIVPRRLLELPQLKFIHIHPGYLPDVRGADCALWSQLMKGRTSATCFYMAPGIDDGDVIHSAWLPSIKFQTDASNIPLKSLYRAVYAFFDPWIRATVLRQSIVLTKGFSEVDPRPQVEGNSITYHFMHERIQLAAFETLFLKHKA